MHPRTLLAFAALSLVACSTPDTAARADWDEPGRILDLTHPFGEETIYWPTAEGFRLRVDSRGRTEGGYHYEANSFSTAEHGGTHIDAPVHFGEGKRTVDEVPLEQLLGPGIVVDVREACARDRDHLVTTGDLQAWEREHGPIPAGTIVLLHTGFGRFWPDRVRYMGTDGRGPEAVKELHFPGLDPAAARWLVGERSIRAVGLDTPSIDHGPSRSFDTHRVLSEANVPALENVARLDLLPASGFTVIALPMKIRGGSGGPVRIAAIFR
jgi:kynurenine formamidase